MNSSARFRYGAEYDPGALRAAMEARGLTEHEMARLCGVCNGEVRKWMNPPSGRRMHWKTVNRIRAALSLTEEQVNRIWRMKQC